MGDGGGNQQMMMMMSSMMLFSCMGACLMSVAGIGIYQYTTCGIPGLEMLCRKKPEKDPVGTLEEIQNLSDIKGDVTLQDADWVLGENLSYLRPSHDCDRWQAGGGTNDKAPPLNAGKPGGVHDDGEDEYDHFHWLLQEKKGTGKYYIISKYRQRLCGVGVGGGYLVYNVGITSKADADKDGAGLWILEEDNGKFLIKTEADGGMYFKLMSRNDSHQFLDSRNFSVDKETATKFLITPV